jgi:Glutamate decarboxylase and related PLP-dependent proteins
VRSLGEEDDRPSRVSHQRIIALVARPDGSPVPLATISRMSNSERPDWHPEPELISVRDADVSRAALRDAGAAIWETALDYVYDHAFVRAMGEPIEYEALRADFFGASGRPAPAPVEPTTLQAVLDEFSARIAPHTVSAYHPRSFGYFTPPPLLASVAGELLAQVAQQGIDIWHAGPIGAFVEEEVLRWLCDLVGYGEGSFGILTSGGVMANFIAMALVRDVHLPRVRGLTSPPRGRALEGVRVYASDQTHFSIGRALDELGFPPETLVVVPADADFRLRGAPVAEAIAEDRAAGLLPIAIAAVAGSTNTGSVDRVGELADVAEREGLWLHIDAAYGAAARLSPRHADRMADLERADSVTVDPHKWFFQAYDIGGLMVRDGSALGQAFGGRRPEYYRAGHGPAPVAQDDHDDGHGSADQLNFWRLGFEGTRRWRALKLWLSWKHVGSVGFGKLVAANVDLADHMSRLIAATDDFEALPEAQELSVVCFRHLPGGSASAHRLAPEALDAHQDRLQRALERSGDGWVSTTRLRGQTYLRAGILNTQSVEADVEALLEHIRALGESVAEG